MRILVAANCFPWPRDTGARMRLGTAVAALAELGDVDLFVVLDTDRPEDFAVPADAVVSRVEVVSRPRSSYTGLRRLRWLATGRMPSGLTGRDYTEVRRRFRAWAADQYDLVWFSQAEPWLALGDLVAGPRVADLFDLEDQKARGRLAATRGGSGRSPTEALRGVAAAAKAGKDARSWVRVQKRLAADVDVVVLCSESDRELLRAGNRMVVPNSYERPAAPVGRHLVAQPPTLLFQGFLRYPPNVDAATYLVGSIVPLLRHQHPDLAVRLAGDADDEVRVLDDRPRVVVAGWVADMTTELAMADVVVVPIRFGSGTRVKILEAFAHGIPVVSTRLGAQGLDVVDGRHLLLADSPEDFARACHRLLTDTALRSSIIAAAGGLLLDRYESGRIRDQVRAVAKGLAGSPGSHAAGGRAGS